MKILLLYVLGLILLSYLFRRWKARPRSLVMVGYNYLFAIPLLFMAQLPEGASSAEALNLFLRCVYQAPKALTFSADLSPLHDPAITLLFYIMSIYTIRAVLLAFFQRAVMAVAMRIRLLWKREIFVVCGEAEDAKAMIREIHAHRIRPAILFVPQRESDGDAKVSALVETRPWDRFLRPNRRYQIVLLPDSRNMNLQRLEALNALNALNEGGLKLRVTTFLNNDLLRHEDFRYPNLDVYLVSREQLLIRKFMNENPPLQALIRRGEGGIREGIYRPARPFSLGILGFGQLSREFLLTTWENAAFETDVPDSDGFSAVILDSGISGARASFFLDVPQIARQPGVDWLDAAPDSEECFRLVRGKLKEFHQILIATEDTRRNLDIAMRLSRMFRQSGLGADHPQLVIALYENRDGDANFLSREADGLFLQCNSDQFTFEELIERATDQQAEALHRRYSKSSENAADWRRLGSYAQNSNRAVIWDIPNKLLLAGDLRGRTAEERERVYWELARYEHRRWCAFQYTHGWTALPMEELTPEEIRAHITKRAAQKRHACLVPWEDLDKLPQERPGLLKWFDYENVTALFAASGEDSAG